MPAAASALAGQTPLRHERDPVPHSLPVVCREDGTLLRGVRGSGGSR
jgi:hypothetical protein